MKKMILGLAGLVAVGTVLGCDYKPEAREEAAPIEAMSEEDRLFIEQHGVTNEDIEGTGEEAYEGEPPETIA